MCFVHDGSEDAIRVGQEHRPQQFTVSSTNCSGEILGGRQYPARSEFRGKECSVRIRCPACPLSGRTVSSPCCGMVFADEGAVASLNAPDEFIVLESSIRRTCGGCHRALADRPTVSDTPPVCSGSGFSRSVGGIRSWSIPVPPSLLGLGRIVGRGDYRRNGRRSGSGSTA